MTRVLVCPASFKGTLSAREATEAIAEGIRSARPEAQLDVMPLADGGEGTLDALLTAGGTTREQEVSGPDGRAVRARWAVLPVGAGAIETAQATSARGRNVGPLAARTSAGVGELIRVALSAGCRRLLIGLGGSATNDGGMGAMRALGARFLDASGKEMNAPLELGALNRIDLGDFADFSRTEVTIASDVDSPLLGPFGATRMFGPQKGGSPEELDALERAMERYAHVLEQTFDGDVAAAPGAGAAGGLGAALFAFLRARARPGIDVVMDAIGFDRAASEADVIVTGEGRLDEQSLHGKAVAGVARRARGRKVFALCGQVALEESAWRGLGLSGVRALAPIGQIPADPRRALVEAASARGLLALLEDG